MEALDDDLIKFEAEGAAPLPEPTEQGYIEHDGARIWYSTYGSGLPVNPAAWRTRPRRQLGISGSSADQRRLSCHSDRQPRPRPQHTRRAAVLV